MIRAISHLSEPVNVLCRLDLDVSGHDHSEIRVDLLLDKALETLNPLIAKGHSILVVSHTGRTSHDYVGDHDSLLPFIEHLSQICDKEVKWLPNWPATAWEPQPGEIALAENTRFLKGELTCSADLVTKMLKNVDVVVYDALSVAPLRHATTFGITKGERPVYLGQSMAQELNAFSPTDILGHGSGLILGGNDPEKKIPLIPALADHFEWIIVGGELIAPFVRAKQDRCVSDEDFIAQWLLNKRNVHIPLDVRLMSGECYSIQEVTNTDLICDVGDDTIAWWSDMIKQALHTIAYGTLGFCEHSSGMKGTQSMVHALSHSVGVKMVVGYDLVAHCHNSGYLHKMDQYSFAGDALIHHILKKPLAAMI